MLIKPDLSDVKDTVGAGEYLVRVVKADVGKWEGKNGKKDTSWINWSMDTFDEADVKNNGRRIFHKTPFTGGGAFRLQEFYRAATGAVLEPGMSIDTEELLGKEVKVVVIDGVNRQTGDPTGYTEVKTVSAI